MCLDHCNITGGIETPVRENHLAMRIILSFEKETVALFRHGRKISSEFGNSLLQKRVESGAMSPYQSHSTN